MIKVTIVAYFEGNEYRQEDHERIGELLEQAFDNVPQVKDFHRTDAVVENDIMPQTLQIGMDVTFRDEEDNLQKGFIFNINLKQRPNTIEVAVVDENGQESLLDQVPIVSLLTAKMPEGSEFDYLRDQE